MATTMNDLTSRSLSMSLISLIEPQKTDIIVTTAADTPVFYMLPAGARHVDITSTVATYLRFSKETAPGSGLPEIVASLTPVTDGTGATINSGTYDIVGNGLGISICTIGEAGIISITSYK